MTRKRICPAQASTLLFVEGGDEERLIQALVGPGRAFCLPFHGRTPEKVDEAIALATRDPAWTQGRLRHVGMIVDAEEDASEAEALAARVFGGVGRPTPPGPAQVFVDALASERAGYFVLPDADHRGSMESLLRRAADPRVGACIDALFECRTNPGTTTALRDKAWMGAYLAAWAGNPRVDQAWDSGFSASHLAFDPLRRFLQTLLGA